MPYLPFTLVFVALFMPGMSDAETQNITQPKCGEKEKTDTLLDVANNFMNKAKDLYPDCIDDELNCGKKGKSLAFLEVASNLISEANKNYPICPDEPASPIQPEGKPMDCSEVLESGKKVSGVYTIWPRSRVSAGKPLAVFCDMDTDGGGWTVIQRRGNFSTPKDFFYKDWESYKIGFGNLEEEFWIGNDNIFAISNQAKNSIRLDLKDAAGATGFAQYDTFWIEDEIAKYTLHIKGFTGNVGDALTYHNNSKFTTKDQRNDVDSVKRESCAIQHHGAWWYKACHQSNLNGLYQPGVVASKGIVWYKWKNSHVGLAGVEIKLRSNKV